MSKRGGSDRRDEKTPKKEERSIESHRRDEDGERWVCANE